MWETIITISVIVLVFILIIFPISYIKVKPDVALIITGPRKSRVVIGKATLRVPFFERTDYVPLSLIQTDIKTASAVPTNEFINIFVDGVANIKIKDDENDVRLAGQIFLTESLEGIKAIAKEVLEGNMREIIGQMRLKELVQNRELFAEKVRESAMQDMGKMGLEIINITIQNFSDKNGVIEDLGVDNITQIRKDASIARANSERDIAIATAEAKELANKSQIESELKMAEQNTQLSLKQAELKEKADSAKATADIAYEIRKAEEVKRVNIAEQDAEIAKREKEIELRSKEAEVEEKNLDAKVKKVAEANKYAAQQRADADLYSRTKEAEAKLAEEKSRAEALKVAAEAERFSQEQKAAGIQAVGLAEAEAIEKKAEAMKAMGEASVLELFLKSDLLPKVVAAAATPLANVDRITMWGDGNSTKLVSDVMGVTTKVIEGIKGATGLDLTNILSSLKVEKLLTDSEKGTDTTANKEAK